MVWKWQKGAKKTPTCIQAQCFVGEGSYSGKSIIEASEMKIFPHYSQGDFLPRPNLAFDHLFGYIWMQ